MLQEAKSEEPKVSSVSYLIDCTLLKRLPFSPIAPELEYGSFLYSNYRNCCGLGAIADRHLDPYQGCPRAICSPPSPCAVSPTSAIYSGSNFP
jgi:hypothetical protein